MKTLIGEVPDDWIIADLGDVCDVLAGPSGELARTVDLTKSGVPMLAPKDIGDGWIIEESTVHVSPETARRLQRYRLIPGDIIGVRTGSIGRYALAGIEHGGWLFGTACLCIRPKERLDHRYLLHYLRNPAIRDWVQQNSLKSTIHSINRKTIRSIQLVIPPPSVQESVGGLLAALDEKIAIHKEISLKTAEFRDLLSPLFLTGSLPHPYSEQLGGDDR
jgi:type I restriction enzyme, S subunit